MEALIGAVMGLLVWGAVTAYKTEGRLDDQQKKLDGQILTIEKMDDLIIDKATERMNRIKNDATKERALLLDQIRVDIDRHEIRINRLESYQWHDE